MRPCPPLKRSKSTGGMKFASPSPSPPSYPLSSERPVVALMSPMPSPDNATHDAILPLLDQGVVQRVTSLAPGPRPPTRPLSPLPLSSFFVSITDCLSFFPFSKTAFASGALADGNSTLHQ
ncbi:hypothetical protein LIER_39229 [Lithospermum erythrorhizon]|uniref:Uncharacterized protein n=1 Tax=Lithospermum erythrorhizon TaxID=34254 RepID=A0AAV3QBK8_LITER